MEKHTITRADGSKVVVTVPPRECPCGCGCYEDACRLGGVHVGRLLRVGHATVVLGIRHGTITTDPSVVSLQMIAAAYRVAAEAALTAAASGAPAEWKIDVTGTDVRVRCGGDCMRAARVLRDAAETCGVRITNELR